MWGKKEKGRVKEQELGKEKIDCVYCIKYITVRHFRNFLSGNSFYLAWPLGHGVDVYMRGISQDVKRLKMWDFCPLFFGFS